MAIRKHNRRNSEIVPTQPTPPVARSQPASVPPLLSREPKLDGSTRQLKPTLTGTDWSKYIPRLQYLPRGLHISPASVQDEKEIARIQRQILKSLQTADVESQTHSPPSQLSAEPKIDWLRQDHITSFPAITDRAQWLRESSPAVRFCYQLGYDTEAHLSGLRRCFGTATKPTKDLMKQTLGLFAIAREDYDALHELFPKAAIKRHRTQRKADDKRKLSGTKIDVYWAIKIIWKKRVGYHVQSKKDLLEYIAKKRPDLIAVIEDMTPKVSLLKVILRAIDYRRPLRRMPELD